MATTDLGAVELEVELEWSGSLGTRSWIELDNRGNGMLVCRAAVGPGNVPRLVLGSANGEWPRDVLWDALDRALLVDEPGAVGALLVDYGEGFAVLVGRPSLEHFAAQVAAAAAVMRVSWGWDESSSILVRIDDRPWRVWPRFKQGVWIAVVEGGTRFE